MLVFFIIIILKYIKNIDALQIMLVAPNFNSNFVTIFFFHIENKIKKRENSKFQILDFFVNIHIHKLNPTIQKEDIYTIIKEFVVTLCVQ